MENKKKKPDCPQIIYGMKLSDAVEIAENALLENGQESEAFNMVYDAYLVGDYDEALSIISSYVTTGCEEEIRERHDSKFLDNYYEDFGMRMG